MEHGAHTVDLFDDEGKVVGKKARRDIDKAKDIYHVVFTQVITPRGELVLGVIPPREDLPNIYSRLMGTTVATIRRSGETSAKAARRSVDRELFIDEAELHYLGDYVLDLPESTRKFASAYYMIGDPPATFSVIDIDTLVVVTPQQLRGLLMGHSNEIAPTLRVFWEKFSSKLPI